VRRDSARRPRNDRLDDGSPGSARFRRIEGVFKKAPTRCAERRSHEPAHERTTQRFRRPVAKEGQCL